MTSNDQEHLDSLMDWYNFSKVADAMQHLQWQWAFCECPNRVPDEPHLRDEVRKQFRKLIKECAGRERYSMGTGGFEYVVYCDYKGDVEALELKFVLSEWSTFV